MENEDTKQFQRKIPIITLKEKKKQFNESLIYHHTRIFFL